MIVVAGVDDSPVSRLVVDRAIREVRWRDSELRLVHVLDLPMVYTEVPIDWSDVVEAQRQAVWDNLEGTLSGVDVPWLKVDLDGYPPDVPVGHANQVEADLLVVGTRGRGEFASLILGSTSHKAIHLARCDVLVVKAEMSGHDEV